MELVGTGEIKRRHGITRVQVSRLIASDDFPEPAAELQNGRVWDAEVVADAIERLHVSGRLTRDGRLVPHRFLSTPERSTA